MNTVVTERIKSVAASLIVISASMTAVLPSSALAATVTGSVVMNIDNTQFATATSGWTIDSYYNAGFNASAINSSTTGGANSTSNMVFLVNGNSALVSYPSVNRSLQETTMDTGDTSVGQIGLSGGLRISVPGFPLAGYLAPYDFSLQKFNGTWNLVSHDQSFGSTTFLQLANANESLNGNGQLLLSGDLVFGGGVDSHSSPNIFNHTWSSFLTANGFSVSPNTVIGTLSLTPAPVPVPSAVWLLGSAVVGWSRMLRRKAIPQADR